MGKLALACIPVAFIGGFVLGIQDGLDIAHNAETLLADETTNEICFVTVGICLPTPDKEPSDNGK
jgi:hypothetical protein